MNCQFPIKGNFSSIGTIVGPLWWQLCLVHCRSNCLLVMLSNSTNVTARPLYRKMFYFVTLINATDIRLRTDINSLCYMTYTPHLKAFQTKRSTMYIQSVISDKLDKLDLTSVYSSCWGFSELKRHFADVFQCTALEKCVRMSILWVVRHANGLTVSSNCIFLVYIACNCLKF
jgi:hypothetical protein